MRFQVYFLLRRQELVPNSRGGSSAGDQGGALHSEMTGGLSCSPGHCRVQLRKKGPWETRGKEFIQRGVEKSNRSVREINRHWTRSISPRRLKHNNVSFHTTAILCV